MSKDVKNYNYYIRSNSSATIDFAKDYFLNRLNQRQSDYSDWLWLATMYNFRDGGEYLVMSSEIASVMGISEEFRWTKKGDAQHKEVLSALQNVSNEVDLIKEELKQEEPIKEEPAELDLLLELIKSTGKDVPEDMIDSVKESIKTMFCDLIDDSMEPEG